MINSFIKKTTSVLLTILLLTSCVFSANITAGAVTVPSSAKYSLRYPSAYIAIVNGIENLETEIDLKDANIPNTTIDGIPVISYIFQEVLEENPQFFYLDKKYGYSGNSETIIGLSVLYTADNDTISTMKRELYLAAGKYLALLDDSMTDYEKALVLHDAIALNCEYDEALGTTDPYAFTAYGVLCKNRTVCEGYSYAYKYLLDLAGIECHIVSSNQMSHAWNSVCIDGKYYNVDVTFDDPVHDKIGRVDHKYFLLSDEYIQNNTENGFTKHFGYSSDYKATSEKFDNYFWKDISSAFNYYDGNWYFADTNGNIYKGNTDNMQKEILLTVTDKWRLGNTNNVYPVKFAKPFIHNGYLYYNTPDNVYRVSLTDATDTGVVYSNNDETNHLFGIAKKLDNVVYASVLSDYNTVDNVVEIFDLSRIEEPTTEPTTDTSEPTTVSTEPTSDITEPSSDATEPTSGITEPSTDATEPTSGITEPSTDVSEPTSKPVEIIITLGDVNGDSKVNIKDATNIQMHLAFICEFDEAQQIAADVTGDGKLKINDATDIQRFVAGIITQFEYKG